MQTDGRTLLAYKHSLILVCSKHNNNHNNKPVPNKCFWRSFRLKQGFCYTVDAAYFYRWCSAYFKVAGVCWSWTQLKLISKSRAANLHKSMSASPGKTNAHAEKVVNLSGLCPPGDSWGRCFFHCYLCRVSEHAVVVQSSVAAAPSVARVFAES